MKNILLIFVIFLNFAASANDGAFFASGNHLIPIKETDVRVQKEILTLRKIQNKYIEVTVYYEFFNPKESKNITVGFEAFSPSGDVDGRPVDGKHPYMRDFTVQMNDTYLKYNVAYVEDDSYLKTGVLKSLNPEKLTAEIYDENNVGFYYVYYFNAEFKKGLNIIKHTYTYDLSSSVEFDYDFAYILTAANRWGNNQIDDFTLIIEPGEFESFYVSKNFFDNISDWKLVGPGKISEIKGSENYIIQNDAMYVHLQKGNIVFQKQNFSPKAELYVFSQRNYKATKDYVPFSYYKDTQEPNNDFEKKILKNLPFARRGYVFKNQELKSYFEKIDWYVPNPNYVPEISTLTPEEKEFVEKYSK